MNEHGAGSFGGMCILMAAIEAAGTLDTETVAATLRALKLEEFYGHPINFNANQQNAAEPLVLQYQRAVRTRMTIVAPQKLSNGVLQFPMPTWEQRRCRLAADSSTAEAAVIAGSGGSGSSASASASAGECSGHGSCTLGGTCACEMGYSGVSCACFGNCVPTVYSVIPSVVVPEGGGVSIIGSNFVPGIITVTVDNKVCASPVFKSNTLIECIISPGFGGPHTIVVACGGVPSAPRKLVAYHLPHIYDISKGWVADGSKLLVTGAFFIPQRTKCRLADHPESFATVIDDSHLECVLLFSQGAEEGSRKTFEISNDDGARWVSGMALNAPIEWGGGTSNPVSPRTIKYVTEVVVGGIVPTDQYSGEKGRQYVKDISLALNMAAKAVNAAKLFPGNIQLRVEILPVDPGGSGTPTTVTEVATAFAMQGVATNASTTVGTHDPSKCLEFGFPIRNKWQVDPECCSVHARAGCSGGYNTVKGVECGRGSWGVAHFTKCEATATARGLTNVIGIAGPNWSSNAIPVAHAVSNPFRLPVVSYNAWTSALDNATEFPFFTRVGPANSDISKVVGVFLRSMGWSRIAIVTDDDAFTSDYGKQVANDMKENGGTVLYRGVSKTLPSQAAVNKQGRIHTESVRNISSHLIRAQEKGARIFVVGAKHTAGRLALYDALDGTGVLGKGYAVFVIEVLALSNEFIATGQQRVNGIVHMSQPSQLDECKVAACPHEAYGPTCAADATRMNQAYDAVLTLATALAPLFRDGGARYLTGETDSRREGMAAIRATSLSADIAASGLLELSPGSTKRDKWNFG